MATTKTETVSVIEQARISTGNPLALSIGAVLGGVVSLAAFVIVHVEHPELWSLKSLFVAGALAFSAKSVFQWTSKAFQDTAKALGWTILVEGCMLISDTSWLNYLMLGLLIGINACATGCNLALQDQADHEASKARAEKLAKDKAKRAEKRMAKVQMSGNIANDNGQTNRKSA